MSDRQQRLICAVEQLGECTTGQVVAALGEPSAKATSVALARLRDRGLITHNGGHARRARWRPAGYTPPAEDYKPPREPGGRIVGLSARETAEHDLAQRTRARIVELLAENGPTGSVWIADQLVKNRREIAAVMREMARCGVIVETGDGGYDAVRDQAVAA